jgi:membrane-associated phospholipid phosphatase
MATTGRRRRVTGMPLRLWREHAFLRELALVALAALTYFGVRNLTVGAAGQAFANAERLIRLEARLQLDWEQALQDALLGHDWLVTFFNWIYIWGHWPVIITAAVVLYRTRRDRYLLLRNAMFLSGAIGFLFFALLPVAPPRLVDPALIDTVTQQSEAYRALQPPGLTNQYAAFPSLHFGWNLLLGVVVYGSTRRVLLRALSVIGPTAMALAVVVTANHYVVDLVGGAVIVLFALWVVKRRRDPLAATLPG